MIFVSLQRWSIKRIVTRWSRVAFEYYCEPSQAVLSPAGDFEDASVEPPIWYGAFDVILLKSCVILYQLDFIDKLA